VLPPFRLNDLVDRKLVRDVDVQGSCRYPRRGGSVHSPRRIGTVKVKVEPVPT
jgi:hypothetical protein